MGQDYANPFFSQYHAQNIRNGQMLKLQWWIFKRKWLWMWFNGFQTASVATETQIAVVTGKSRTYNNADGSSSTNNLLYLLLGAGFVWLMINIDNKRSYK